MTKSKISWQRVLMTSVVLTFALFCFLLIFSLFPATSEKSHSFSASAENLLEIEKEHRLAVATTVELADRFHYRNRTLDNTFSKEILDNYLQILDSQKSYFLQSDIDEFYRHQLYFDDYLKDADLQIVFEIFKIFQERVHERMEYAKSLLDFPFDFELSEVYVKDRSEADWPNSQEEYDLLWKKIVKDAIISQGSSNPDRSQVLNSLFARYQRLQQTVALNKAVDVVELFLNSYLQELDPYSEYFSPHSSDNLEISISQQIEGIGAMLRNENEVTVVHSVITGGPAARSNKIHAGDKIVAVAKDENQIFVDIVGWRLGDVVDLIRGPKGTTVFLKVIPNGSIPGTSPIVVAIVREKIKIEDQMASTSTVEIDAEGQLLRLAVISLPAFYSELYKDDEGEHQRTSSNDVKKFLEDLVQQHIDGVIIDLRGNGGGALNEAVELTSLFIENGPVVQIENASGDVEVKSDVDNKVVYNGPLVVLVDRASASASEIFAAAIQDYRRGIIVGETTYGKGMLQTIWPFNRLEEQKSAGAIKLSTAQFYRVTGTSPQHFGVTPDLVYDTDQFVSDQSEGSSHNSIPSGTIEPVRYFSRWYESDLYESHLDELAKRHDERSQLNPVLRFYVDRESYIRELAEITTVELNENKRLDALEQDTKSQLKLINDLRQSLGLESVDELAGAFPEERAGDAYLDEAINILADFVTLIESDADTLSQQSAYQPKFNIYQPINIPHSIFNNF